MGYPKQVYDRAWAELARREKACREETLARKAEIHRLIPEIEDIEREMARQGASVAKAAISDPKNSESRIRELSENNLACQRRREDLLISAGYPADYLAERHSCHLCRDAGYIGSKMCGCFESLLRKEAASYLGKFSPVQDCTFGSFITELYPEAPDGTGVSPRARMKEVFISCKRWSESFSPKSESLLLLGRTGLGKTHLSIAMARALISAGYGVVYSSAQRMMDALEAEKFSRDQKAEGAADIFLNCDALILDDLGTEFSTQFTSAALFNVINTRLTEGRPTIVNTNLEPSEIESRYSQRMVSRLLGGYRTLLFMGKDIRQKLSRSNLNGRTAGYI